MKLNHQHFMVDCFVNKPLTDVNKTVDFLKRLVHSIGMKIVAGPIAHYCQCEDNDGITGAVCIATSHCSIHVWDKVSKPYMRLDVYSCQEFDTNKVLEMIKEFDSYDIKTHLINRNPND